MGRMGITHYSIINSHPDVQITSISDTSKLILDTFKRYIHGVQVFTDYRDQLEQSELDGIIVCTPPNLHYPICQDACRKKIAVFCEKPFTTDPAQARELFESFSKAGIVNQVGYVNRFNDIFMKTREYVQSGLLGEIIRFKSEIFSCTISKPESGNGWRSRRENGGGVTYEMASHALDLINYIQGKANRVAGSCMNQIYSQNVEDIVSSALFYDDGRAGTLYANWCDRSYRKPSNQLEFFGTNGKLLANQYGMKIYLNTPNSEFPYREGWNTVNITDVFQPVPFYVRGNEFTRQLYHFADSISGKVKSGICTFQAGYEAQEIIHAIFNDANKISNHR